MEILLRIFRYVSASANHQLWVWQLPWNTLSQRAVDIWPVNCPIVQSGHGAFVHSNFLFTQVFTCHLSIPTVSDLFEGIPMSILLFAHLSRFTLLLVNPLFLLVSDSTHPQFFGSVSCPARTLSQNFSMKFVCSA